MTYQEHFKKAKDFLSELDADDSLSNSNYRRMIADTIASIAASRDELVSALKPIAEDADREGRLATIWDKDWNPDAHYPAITLTIGEVRAILIALAKARGEVTP